MSAIENVSRRGFMKGMVSAGALVLSVRLVPQELWAEGLPKDTNVDHAVLNQYGRNGFHHRASLGDGNGNSHFPSPCAGRRTRSRLEASEARAGHR